MRSMYLRRLIEDGRDMYLTEDGYSNELLEFTSFMKDMCSVFIYRISAQHLRCFYESQQITTFCNPEDELLHYMNLKSIK